MSSSVDFVAVFPNNKTIDYHGSWIERSGAGTNLTGNHTVAYGEASDASAVFDFYGVGIAVYGLVEPGYAPVSSAYTLDGASSATYTSPSNVTSNQDGVIFFESPQLVQGQHQLVINVTNGTATNPYMLTFLGYLPSLNISQTSGGSTPTSSTSSRSSTSPAGAIVGGVVGGLGGLVILSFLLYWLISRHRRGMPYFYRSASATDMLHHEARPGDAEAFAPGNASSMFDNPASRSATGLPHASSDVAGESAHVSESDASQPQMSYAASAGGSSTYQLMLHGTAQRPTAPLGKAARAAINSGRFGPSLSPGPVDEHSVPLDVPPSYTET
ncbi:uncharacterized protein FIBRA_02699 [Fibroporia radiculosa]|uniref:Mid2 domain-containing protein n=1 Tax=Fibroporia radiculosa TaxID=599839 RepID=J4I973_9APHY|nr:uncharacterized protein FIBRA_02699 [Fibroporia radiculosa]CCM00661.1 predicted protein [Fibroporia radiculosa]